MIDRCFREIVRTLGINSFVETGTDMGETVAEVSTWYSEIASDFGRIDGFFETGAQSYNDWNTPIRYPRFRDCGDSDHRIWSVEMDKASYEKAVQNFSSNRNIMLVNGSSEKFLREFVAKHGKDTSSRMLFFLDAHWEKYWPIRDELKAIATLQRFAVAIDDFFVPGKSTLALARGDFGFDFYHGRILCWGYVVDCFAPGSIRIFYPSAPNRDRRGWCLIVRGYSPQELEFLGTLGLVEMAPDDTAHKTRLTAVLSNYLDLRVALRTVLPLSWLRKGWRIARLLGIRLG